MKTFGRLAPAYRQDTEAIVTSTGLVELGYPPGATLNPGHRVLMPLKPRLRPY